MDPNSAMPNYRQQPRAPGPRHNKQHFQQTPFPPNQLQQNPQQSFQRQLQQQSQQQQPQQQRNTGSGFRRRKEFSGPTNQQQNPQQSFQNNERGGRPNERPTPSKGGNTNMSNFFFFKTFTC